MKISVVLCCYNGEKSVEKALQSVAVQTLNHKFHEVIFIDDGSTDRTQTIARRFKGAMNFRFYRNAQNQGLPRSCNRAVELAEGSYIIRLDADDEFMPDALEEMVKAAAINKPDFIYSDRWEVHADTGQSQHVALPHFDLFRLIACGVLLKKEILRTIQGYRDMLWEEYDLYLRYLQHTQKPPVYIPKPLYRYVLHEKSMTHQKDWHRVAWQELIKAWGVERLSKFGKIPQDILENAVL